MFNRNARTSLPLLATNTLVVPSGLVLPANDESKLVSGIQLVDERCHISLAMHTFGSGPFESVSDM